MAAATETRCDTQRERAPDFIRPYKSTEQGDLTLHVFNPNPEPADASAMRPAVLLIHSGGWVKNGPQSYYHIARSLSDMGFLVACAQYRLAKPPNTVPDAVADMQDAMIYLRKHAAELRIDPARIAACGGSAGAHLAAALALFPYAGTSETVPPPSAFRPAALILLNPVIDTSPAGYGNRKLGSQWRAFSPLHQVRPDVPPTILFHGTGDRTTPFAGAKAFHEAMLENGNECEFHPHEGGDHGYYRKQPIYDQTMSAIRLFCVKHGLLPNPQKLSSPPPPPPPRKT
ncbi:alpha/beta hydrolase [Opitutaceae bacterium TAV4]|nr:alpha/beta hydrolase [Opitutaceae bacterium TAV4]